jgi:hypothetical protein
VDDDFLQPSSAAAPPQTAGWSSELKASIAAMKAELGASVTEMKLSHTIVLEAAVYLIRRGLLNVKGTPNVNIKQGRALLTFAVWLQYRKSADWVRDDKLAKPAWPLEHFDLLHVGACCK